MKKKTGQNWYVIHTYSGYEDAVKKLSPFLFHSVLSPYLNLGLITPKEIIKKTIDVSKIKKIPIPIKI